MIGCFVINFGAIEIQSYEWVRRLSKDGSHLEVVIKRLFASRVQMLRQLLGDRVSSEPLRLESAKAWDAAEKLAKFRNIIAHSPVVFVWTDREAEGEPDSMGILDYKSATGARSTVMKSIGIQSLSEKIDEAHRVATRLQELLEKLPPTSTFARAID